MKKVTLVSLGCARNLVDSEVMLGLLAKEGYDIGALVEDSDFIIVNTCGFLQSAIDESLDAIADVIERKKKSAKVIVTGCLVQREKEKLQKRFAQKIHYLLGPGHIDSIVSVLKEATIGALISEEQKSFLECPGTARLLSTPPHYAYLKISEGCCKRCAFCLIPQIKGPLKSKPISQVVAEFEGLLQLGVFEIILVGQDLGDFGKDRKESLKELLKSLVKIKGNFWLRLLYLYPDEIDDELIAILKSDSKICPYVDMPLQHISDRVLKAMNRMSTQKTILTTIEKMRSKIPNIALRTTLMVGFPGEEESDFQELLNFVKKYELAHVGIFKFSPEEGTSAAKFANQIDEETKELRMQALATMQFDIVTAKNKRQIGTKLQVIVDGKMGKYYQTRSQREAPEIDRLILVQNSKRPLSAGERITVRICGHEGYDLIGEVTCG